VETGLGSTVHSGRQGLSFIFFSMTLPLGGSSRQKPVAHTPAMQVTESWKLRRSRVRWDEVPLLFSKERRATVRDALHDERGDLGVAYSRGTVYEHPHFLCIWFIKFKARFHQTNGGEAKLSIP